MISDFETTDNLAARRARFRDVRQAAGAAALAALFVLAILAVEGWPA